MTKKISFKKNKKSYFLAVLFVASVFIFTSPNNVFAKVLNLGDTGDVVYIKGNIGIGNDNPSQRLEVDGNIKGNSFCIGASCVTSWGALGGDNLGNHSATQNIHLNNFWLSGDGGNEGIRINAVGNVGVGTSAPSESLEVSGKVKANHFYTGYNWSTKNNGLHLGVDGISGGIGFYDGSTSYSASIFRESGTSNFYVGARSGTLTNGLTITSNGSVGIGTTAPSQKLHVNGKVKFDDVATGVTGTNNLDLATVEYVKGKVGGAGGVGSGTTGQTLRHNGTSWIANSLLYNNGSNVGINTAAPKNILDIKGSAAIGSYAGVNTAPSDSLIVSGNVGIGTVNPGYKLDIAGVGARVRNANFHVDYGTYTGSWARGYLIQNSTASEQYGLTGEFNGDVFKALRLGRYNYDDKGIYILKEGNVGIGTTAPSKKLHVNGTVQFDGVATGVTGTNNLDLATVEYVKGVVGGGVGSGIAGQTLRHNGTGWVSNSILYNNGTNVGIGTVSPGGKLEVKQNMSNYATSFIAPHIKLQAGNTSDNTGFVGITYDSSTSANYGWSSGALRSTNGQSSFVWKNHNSSALGVEAMRITNSGDLGVGTVSPGAKLDVNGSFKSTAATVTGLGATGNSFVKADNSGNLYTEAGMIFKRTVAPNSNYTAKVSDYIIAFNSLSANRVLTLPSPCDAGRAHIIVNETTGTHSVVVTPAGTATISGMASVNLPAYNAIPVYCNGTNWFIY